jgi:hypothetical protein
LPYDSALSFIGIYPKECKSGYNKASCTSLLLQHYSQQLRYGNSQDASILISGSKIVAFIHDVILFSLKEE